jgi:ketosteroid isomerase-like protein
MGQVAVTDYFQSGDKIMVLGSERLTLRRTNQEQALEWAMVMSFRQDRIAEVLVYEDLSILLL